MSEISGLYDASGGSPSYAEADMAKFLNLFSEGVIPGIDNELEVALVSGLTVSIDSGAMVSRGYFYIQDEDAGGASPLTKTLDAEGAGSNRIDNIVIEHDTTNNTASSKVSKGTGTTGTPSAPALVDTSTKWEELLAEVYVTASAIISVTDGRTISGARRRLQAGEVDTDELAPDAVTGAKIADNAVDTEHIADDAVDSDQIAAGAIDAEHVSPGHIVGAKFSISSTQSIPDSTETAVNWTVWDYDPDTSKDGSHASRMVCKYAGYYKINASITFINLNANTTYALYLKKNGTVITRSRNATDDSGNLYLTLNVEADLISLAVDDYIEVFVYQSSGGTEDISGLYSATYLSMRRIVF